MTKQLQIIFYIIIFALLSIQACDSDKKKSGDAEAIPRPEHPRPDLFREEWLNLNGTWEFQYDPKDVGEEEGWFLPDVHFKDSITVPFCWESYLSGQGEPPPDVYPPFFALVDITYRGTAWYRRKFRLPSGFKNKRTFLVFGAVDWESKVWLNGDLVGENTGGYLPFSFDITNLLAQGENTITVRVCDPSEWDPAIPRGKQGKEWFTRASGIWQTVYLEARGESYISGIRFYPDVQNSLVQAELTFSSQGEEVSLNMTIDDPRGFSFDLDETVSTVPGENKSTIIIPLDNRHPDFPSQVLWSPENPQLYYITLRLTSNSSIDRVKTYFGQREVKVDWAPGHDPDSAETRDQYKYIYLNGRPIYLRGLLDQSYNPDGIYTYPTEDYILLDLQTTLDLGFNMLRIHIKAEEPLKLYHADRMGLLIMMDIPNFETLANNTPNFIGREYFESTMRGIIERDFNHPSIIAWVVFNETWGLLRPKPLGENPELEEWVRDMWFLAKELDPTRPVEDNSWKDHQVSDINSWHFYLFTYEAARDHVRGVVDNTYPGSDYKYIGGFRQDGAPLMNSEYSSLSYVYAGNMDIFWHFKYLTNELRLYPKIMGYVYTELTDVEWEYNGLLRYNRTKKESGYEDFGITINDLSGPDFLVIDSPPVLTVPPGDRINLNLKFSGFSGRECKARLSWSLGMEDRLGRPHEGLSPGSLDVELIPFTNTDLGSVNIDLPNMEGAGWVTFDIMDVNGDLITRNYINFETYSSEPPAFEKTDNGLVLRLLKSDIKGDTVDPSFDGSGTIVYTHPIEDPGSLPQKSKAGLIFEASGWKPPVNPQTDEAKSPTDLKIFINDIDIGTVTLEDGPADARGFLSYLNKPTLCGSYGYLTEIEINENVYETIRDRMVQTGTFKVEFSVPGDAVNQGGLRIYDHRNGRYPVPVTLWIQ